MASVESHQVLIIDDDVQLVELLMTFLTMNEFEVLCAYDGRKGIELAKANRPDLIICDYEMPGLNGLTVLGILRQVMALKQTPIILMTGHEVPPYKELFQPLTYVPKPIRGSQLVAIVQDLLTTSK